MLQRQSNCAYRNRSYSQDRNQSYRVQEISSTITEVIGPTIGKEADQGIIGMEIATREAIMPETIEGNKYIQDYGNEGYGNSNRSLSQDCSRSRQRYRSNSRDNFRKRSYDRSQSRNRERKK